jgi:hypothetical protein
LTTGVVLQGSGRYVPYSNARDHAGCVLVIHTLCSLLIVRLAFIFVRTAVGQVVQSDLLADSPPDDTEPVFIAQPLNLNSTSIASARTLTSSFDYQGFQLASESEWLSSGVVVSDATCVYVWFYSLYR